MEPLLFYVEHDSCNEKDEETNPSYRAPYYSNRSYRVFTIFNSWIDVFITSLAIVI